MNLPISSFAFCCAASIVASSSLFGCVKADSGKATNPSGSENVEGSNSNSSSENSESSAPAASNAPFEGTYSTKPSGLLKTVPDAKHWNEGIEKIEKTMAQLGESCEGAKPAIDINYEPFTPAIESKDLSVFEVMAYCHEVMSGLASNCGWDDEAVQAAIRSNVKRVLCEFDATATNNKVNFSYSDGVFRGGVNQSSSNIHFDAQRWSAANIPPAP